MKLKTILTALLTCVAAPAFANFQVADVTVKRIVSPNSSGHLYVELSGVNNCSGTASPYLIIDGWNDTSEPGATKRSTMLSFLMTAYATGKPIGATGTSCYLDNYLIADSIELKQ